MGAPARSSMLVGARLGAYEVVRLIGQGATASVFEGQHVGLGKRVAIKVLHEHLHRDDQIAARFLREGRIAARLQHPHVLEVVDLGQDGGLAWLVMEFLDGHDLKAELASAGRLSVEEAVSLLLPIASALAYAHAQGAVHRDVKPANVFLARDDVQRVLPKIVDFGLSKLQGLDDTKPLTESEIVAGSVAYMAPEQTYGIARAGAAADQFSFGAVLYECLTGHAPFQARTFYELIERIRESHPPPPSATVSTLPAGLDAVVLRALAADPAERWAGLRALGAELLAFADEGTRAGWHRDFVDEPSRAGRIFASPRPMRAAAPVRSAPPEAECPALPRRPGSSPFFIKGLSYRGFVALVGRTLPGGMNELEASIEDPDLRAFLRQPFLASSRYDILPFRPLTASLARLLGRPYGDLVRVAAAAQARYDARTVFRQMFAGATLDDWEQRMPRLGTQYYYGFGRFEGVREGPSTVVSRHSGVPEYLVPWYAPMQVAYGEEAARILGARDVSSELLPQERSGEVDGLPTVITSARLRWHA
jgi:tRNA A-37 threonylcarbamoyl transferase component Bud32